MGDLSEPQRSSALLEFGGEGEQICGRSSEPVEGCDNESVPLVEGVDCGIELGPVGSGAADSVVDVEVVAADAGGE